MQIHQYIKRGEKHPDYCEDFSIISEKGSYMLFGVFDGCSSGTESHFASALTGKIFRAEFQKLKLTEKSKPKKTIRKLFYKSILALKKYQKKLKLPTEELLSTIILFLYNKETNKGIIAASGDGVISVNGKNTIIDKNNVPDYPAYYLDKINNRLVFEIWLTNHVQLFTIKKANDVSISTDGILSFVNKNTTNTENQEINPIDYLLKDDFLIKNMAMLGRKTNILNNKHSLYNLDDLGIIRVVLKDDE